ncbi:hypothetical protein M404DRAFT_514431 [Pisolithus tinctorius Marx 270]|uniref:Uncharacterized protein n=1 Tax=Pisolithus tinctorius Marx 270 TaxID=870435 RepID=A0A0C3I8G1_PISTI|nr:hypothetical protein M404DRAFT_514431 [Pisolithus tinctorius Marx 270]
MTHTKHWVPWRAGNNRLTPFLNDRNVKDPIGVCDLHMAHQKPSGAWSEKCPFASKPLGNGKSKW